MRINFYQGHGLVNRLMNDNECISFRHVENALVALVTYWKSINIVGILFWYAFFSWWTSIRNAIRNSFMRFVYVFYVLAETPKECHQFKRKSTSILLWRQSRFLYCFVNGSTGNRNSVSGGSSRSKDCLESYRLFKLHWNNRGRQFFFNFMYIIHKCTDILHIRRTCTSWAYILLLSSQCACWAYFVHVNRNLYMLSVC